MGKIADALEKIDILDELSSPAEKEPDSPLSEPVRAPKPRVRKTIRDSELQPSDPIDRSEPPPSNSAAEPTSSVVLSVNESKVPASQTVHSEKWDARLLRAVNDDPLTIEVFNKLRSNILYPSDGRTVPKSIMVASSIPKEGKSFVTANLGVSLASGMDQYCLLVDCDLRQPNLAQLFGINRKYGLVDFLTEQVDLSKLIVKTSVPKLSVLPAGKAPQNPAELLSSKRMKKLMQEISHRYDDRIVIFDSPPMLAAAESIILSGEVDAVILVVRQAKVKKGEVQKFLEAVDQKKILGIVFNDHIDNYSDQSLAPGYGYSY